jgi:hypothetical protein
MAIPIPRRVRNSLIKVATEDQTKLTAALTLLFDLLEKYSPPWYEKQHHQWRGTPGYALACWRESVCVLTNEFA